MGRSNLSTVGLLPLLPIHDIENVTFGQYPVEGHYRYIAMIFHVSNSRQFRKPLLLLETHKQKFQTLIVLAVM